MEFVIILGLIFGCIGLGNNAFKFFQSRSKQYQKTERLVDWENPNLPKQTKRQ